MLTTLSSKRIGANLKRLIKESEFRTQEAFAEACYADARVIRRWIKDGIKNIDTIALVAKTLNVDVMALLF
jgi:hypothetical protein